MKVPVAVEVGMGTGPDGEPVLHVDPVWDGVDRPTTGGWMLPDSPNGRRLAARLKAALLAGVVYSATEILTDVNGKTYVGARSRVLGRIMNADLKRLGF